VKRGPDQEKESISMESRTLWAIVAVAGAVFLMMHAGHISTIFSGTKTPAPVAQASGTGSLSQTGSAGLPGAGTGPVQTFTLRSNAGQYDPAVIRVKQGTKVRIEGDPVTLSGCMAVVNIAGDYGISKLITPGDNVIEFTADKTGTFPMYCDMGIGNGKLIVE
jgi:plastocyanin